MPSEEEIKLSFPKQIGQYEIMRQIGQGAMGVVYEAYQKGLHRKVALKMLPSTLAGDRTFLKRFRNEAAAAAKIHHPNIATIYDYGEIESGPFIAMECISGKTLEEILSEKGLPFETALTVAEKTAEALSYAHSQGVIHRDVKAANVMLDDSGRVVIMDFGLAKIENATLLTIDGTIMGTPGYMAPEQAQPDEDHPASFSVDIYSLGVLMYEMFTGELPFKGQNHLAVLKKVLEEDPLPPSKINSKISRDLEIIILKAMEKNPPSRYATAQALADDIKRFRAGEPIQARPTSTFIRILRKSRKYRAAVGTFFIVLILAGVWTIYLFYRHSQSQDEYKKILNEAHSQLRWMEEQREVLLEKLSEDPLFSVLQSRDPLMRAQAIIALNQKLREKKLKGQLREDSFNLTLKALEDPHPLVRRHAAILLGILKDSRASDALLKRIDDEDAEVRKHVILALGLLQETKAVAKILNYLKDANEGVRSNTALALGLLKSKESVDALAGALKDPFPNVRSNAAAALGSVQDSKAIDPLIQVLNDNVEEVRNSVEEALTNFGERARMPVMLFRLQSPDSPPAELIRVLREINPEKDQQAFEAVLKLLKHQDSDVRYNAVLVAGLFQDLEAVPALVETLKDSDIQVRENARLALIGLSGTDFEFDQKAWEEWYKSQKQ